MGEAVTTAIDLMMQAGDPSQNPDDLCKLAASQWWGTHIIGIMLGNPAMTPFHVDLLLSQWRATHVIQKDGNEVREPLPPDAALALVTNPAVVLWQLSDPLWMRHLGHAALGTLMASDVVVKVWAHELWERGNPDRGPQTGMYGVGTMFPNPTILADTLDRLGGLELRVKVMGGDWCKTSLEARSEAMRWMAGLSNVLRSNGHMLSAPLLQAMGRLYHSADVPPPGQSKK